MPSFEWLLFYAVLGFGVGFLAGLLGVGGGGLMVPLLVAMFSRQGLDPEHVVHFALGTSLAAMVFSSASSGRAHARRQAVCWTVVWGMTPGVIVGASLATRLAANLDSRTLAVLFSIFMGSVAVQMFMNWQPSGRRPTPGRGGLFGAGTVIGGISSLAAVGGGFLTIAYLSYRNLEMKEAVGTSAAMGFPIAAAASIGYLVSGWSNSTTVPYSLGFIYVPAFLLLAWTSFVAAPLGVGLSHRLSGANLKRVFAVLSAVVSIRMLASL